MKTHLTLIALGLVIFQSTKAHASDIEFLENGATRYTFYSSDLTFDVPTDSENYSYLKNYVLDAGLSSCEPLQKCRKDFYKHFDQIKNNVPQTAATTAVNEALARDTRQWLGKQNSSVFAVSTPEVFLQGSGKVQVKVSYVTAGIIAYPSDDLEKVNAAAVFTPKLIFEYDTGGIALYEQPGAPRIGDLSKKLLYITAASSGLFPTAVHYPSQNKDTNIFETPFPASGKVRAYIDTKAFGMNLGFNKIQLTVIPN